jgi:hypothetical protein
VKTVAIIQPDTTVIAEMITHDYIWRGAGATCDEAREALLSAWAQHRAQVVSQQPALAPTLPEAGQMQQHFKIRYCEYTRGAGYRDEERLV